MGVEYRIRLVIADERHQEQLKRAIRQVSGQPMMDREGWYCVQPTVARKLEDTLAQAHYITPLRVLVDGAPLDLPALQKTRGIKPPPGASTAVSTLRPEVSPEQIMAEIWKGGHGIAEMVQTPSEVKEGPQGEYIASAEISPGVKVHLNPDGTAYAIAQGNSVIPVPKARTAATVRMLSWNPEGTGVLEMRDRNRLRKAAGPAKPIDPRQSAPQVVKLRMGDYLQGGKFYQVKIDRTLPVSDRYVTLLADSDGIAKPVAYASTAHAAIWAAGAHVRGYTPNWVAWMTDQLGAQVEDGSIPQEAPMSPELDSFPTFSLFDDTPKNVGAVEYGEAVEHGAAVVEEYEGYEGYERSVEWVEVEGEEVEGADQQQDEETRQLLQSYYEMISYYLAPEELTGDIQRDLAEANRRANLPRPGGIEAPD